MSGPSFTRKQFETHLCDLEAGAEKARGSKRFVVDAANIGEAFRQLISQWHAQAGTTTLQYAFPCGSRLKIVCLEDVREKARRMADRKAGG